MTGILKLIKKSQILTIRNQSGVDAHITLVDLSYYDSNYGPVEQYCKQRPSASTCIEDSQTKTFRLVSVWLEVRIAEEIVRKRIIDSNYNDYTITPGAIIQLCNRSN